MKIKTKLILTLAPAFSLIFIGLLWIHSLKPWLLNLASDQIPKINQIQSIIQVSAGQLDFSLIKLQASVNDIELAIKESPSQKILIPQIKIQIDPFSLIIGQIRISYIKSDFIKATLDQDYWMNSNDSEIPEINLEPFFDLLPKLPIQRVILNKPEIDLISQNLRSNLKLKPSTVTITNRSQKLDFDLSTSELYVETETQKSQFLSQFNASLFVNSIQLTAFEIISHKSKIQIKGSAKNIKKLLKEPQFDLTTNGLIIFEDVKPLLFHFSKTAKRLPQILGQLKFTGQLSNQDYQHNKGQFKIETENFQFDFMKFGNALIQTKILNNEISFDQITLNHPSGLVQLNQFEIQQKKPFAFKSKIKVTDFNLQKLFESLDLKDIPANLTAQALGECSGQIDGFNAQCNAKLIVENVLVTPEIKSSLPIVSIDKALLDVKGQFTVDDFKYAANAQIKESSFQSEGTVDFTKGFNLKFNSQGLQLDHIKDIAHLGLKGLISGQLETSGNSSRGIINTKNLKVSNFEIDRFFLGDFAGNLSYEKGVLQIQNINGDVDGSEFSGQVALDFIQSQISTKIEFAKLYGKSLVTILGNHFQWPDDMLLSGQGQAKVEVSGPFDFWQLKYKLDGYLDRGSFHANNKSQSENFKRVHAQITADGKSIQLDDLVIQKQNGFIILSGLIDTENSQNPEFKIKMTSHNLKLDDIDHISALFPNSSGQIKADGQVTGRLSNPQIKMTVVAKDLILDSQSLPISQIDFMLNKNLFSLNGQIFGRQAQVFLQYPFDHQNPFILKSQIRDFNPFILLPLIQLPLPTQEYFSSLSGEIDLKSNEQSHQKIVGTIKIDNLILQRNTQVLKLQKPSTLEFNGHLTQMTPLTLMGSDQQISLYQDHHVLILKGQFSLRPLQFLVPFLDNLTGTVDLNCGFNLKSEKINLVGDGQIKNALMQLKGFPYPLKELSAKIDFSQSKILISNIQTELNQSAITGSGYINFTGSKNIDVNIQAESSRIDLEFPPQMQTNGIIKAKVYGQWIPYTLKIDYLIDQGIITKEFTEADDNLKYIVQPNRYLPPQQLKSQAPTLLLDINPKFTKGIYIKNQILEASAFGELKITGSPESPIISGRIDFKNNSKLIFKDKPFDIQTGYVLFNPNPELQSSEINPEIFLNTNARVSDYDINLLIQGPSKSLDIKPTSQPPLSPNDIFSLLALGFTTSNQNQNLSSDMQQKQTGYEIIANISNQSKINKKIQEKLGLNVQIAPSIDSTKNIAVPKVVVSRKYGKKINASYARPLSGNQQSNEVKLQWLFHPDFSLNLNYQNQTSEQENNIIQSNEDAQGNYGFDLEYKKEFK